MDENSKLWTLQKKIYLLAVTVVAVGSMWALIIAGTAKVNLSIDERITSRAERVADSCDSVRCSKRYPVDSMILAKLDRIGTDIKRTTYFQEQSMSEADYARARSLWVRDSIKWSRE